ncbi:MAG: TlpA family protein disulfide reductase [Chromatiales bacterium]
MAVLAALGGVIAQCHVDGAGVVGRPRIDFALVDIDGKERRLSEWDGKVLVVNFWATWCPPCREEIPDFVKLQQQFEGQGVQFIGIAMDRPDAVREFMASVPINYPVLIGDEEGSIVRQYGNDLGALPYTVVIDRKGKIILTRRGLFRPTEADATIRNLL